MPIHLVLFYSLHIRRFAFRNISGHLNGNNVLLGKISFKVQWHSRNLEASPQILST
ncbi:hypothetical protein NC652_034616 [Populus alba x Populus x berolinensis]|nr:hypothetical protein NC652_034616 [Populus alba x Populus x berolinensis]